MPFPRLLAAAAVTFLVAGCATTTTTTTTSGQSGPTQTQAPYRSPLTGKEVVERLRGGAKQADLALEIQQRGVVEVNAADMDSLKAAGAGPELMDALLTSLAKGPPQAPNTTTTVYRDRYPWVWGVHPWWAPHLGLHWHWRYRRR
jgi:hypothetical protein